MKKLSLDPSRRLDIYLRIDRDGDVTFSAFNEDGTGFPLSYEDFQLVVRRNPGDRISIIDLTIGSGLTINDNKIIAHVDAADTLVNEGEYFWELINLDANKTWISGLAFLHNGAFDAENDDTAITISQSQLVNIYLTVAATSGVGGSGTVESVTGDGVDNTDPDNPVLSFPTPGDIGAQASLGFTPENVANKATDFLTIDNTKYPTTQAVNNEIIARLAGLAWKAPVTCATTANITLSGEQTIDGVATSAMRVLVKNQSTASQNGIYISAAGAWARSSDADTGTEIHGAVVTVQEGTSNENTTWVQTSDGVTIGVTSIVWSQLGTSVPDASPTVKGIARLYSSTSLGTNTDGAPDQNAVKTYVDAGLATKQASLGFTAENVANKDTDVSLAANSDTKYASQKAIKTYVDQKTTVDGVTITGAGTTGSPYVASGLQPGQNLSDVSSATTSRSNLAGSHDRVTITTKASAFTPALADFAGVQPLYECTNTYTLTLPSDSTQAIPVGKIFYGITAATKTTTFAPDTGVTLSTSSGGYTVTPGGAADFVFWSCQKKASNTWLIQIGSPPATSPFGITFLANVQTFTNMPAGVQEITLGTTGRYRSKADLTNYQQVRVTVGVSTAGSASAGFYLQYSTDDSSFTDIGSASGSDIAVIGTTGTKVSGWVNLPTGAKADVFLRCVGISGDGAADPVIGLITAQFR